MAIEVGDTTYRTPSNESLGGLNVLVMGLGRFGGGVAVTRWLIAKGAEVAVTDQASPESLSGSIAQLSEFDVDFRFGAHEPSLLAGIDLVVVNPAVQKRRSDFFKLIVERAIPWTTETNLFCERCPADVIGVTGSFGKSTTCAMLEEVLRSGKGEMANSLSFRNLYLGGNIGKSLLPDLAQIGPNDLVILELSNAQLEDVPRIKWHPNVAVITNLYPQHLDRYESFAEYVAVKLNIVDPAGSQKAVVVGDVDDRALSMLEECGITARENFRRVGFSDVAFQMRVPGEHNQQNASCVKAVCQELGMKEEFVRAAIEEFGGLPHRLQFVKESDGVEYYNDSKSTAPEATVRAMKSFDRPIVLLVGGKMRDDSLTHWANVAAERCRAIVCFGEAGSFFAKAIEEIDESRGKPMVREASTVEKAVAEARSCATRGDVVLFSPGAQSFDAFVNFEARGRSFVDFVSD